jgi:LysR family glycine cleavage system transcriptional activator
VAPFAAPYDAGVGYWLATTPVRWRRPAVRRFRDWLAALLEPGRQGGVQRR